MISTEITVVFFDLGDTLGTPVLSPPPVPRQIIKTEEAIKQQRMSGDPISQWAQECITADVSAAAAV